MGAAGQADVQDTPQLVLFTLLLVYASAVLLNGLVSTLLFLRQRDALTRAQVQVWASTLFALVIQGGAGTALPGVLVGLGSVFAVSAAVAHLLSILANLPMDWRRAFGLLGLGAAGSAVAWWAGMPFAVVTLPLLLGVAWPILGQSARVLALRRGQLSVSERGMALTSLIYGLHMLDFAVLGDRPEMGLFGFSVGLLCIFALSIFAPAVVVEKLATAQARDAAEMDAARRIQTQLVPEAPQVPGLDLCCYMRPADAVGGDYYDVVQVGERSWILLGDVTGHGLSSGLVMLMAQSIFSTILQTRGPVSPAELNRLGNGLLFRNLARMREDRTMTFVSLCVESGQDVVLAGAHDNLYVHRARTGEVEVLEVAQFPFQLGLIEEVPAELVTEARFRLEPGDTLFAITDGVTEAASGGDYSRGLYDEPRLVEFIRAQAGQPLDAIRAALVRELERFTGGVFHDDVTFILARRAEAP